MVANICLIYLYISQYSHMYTYIYIYIDLYYERTGRLLKVHDHCTLRTAHSLLVEFCHHHEMQVFSDLPGQQVWIGPEDSQCEGNVGSIAGLKKALGTSRKFIQHPCCFKMFVWFCDGTKYHQPKHLNHFDLFRLTQNAWVMFRVTSVHCLSCAQARFPKRVSTSVLACLEEMC